jgi:superfamily II DNA or RNA helicase
MSNDNSFSAKYDRYQLEAVQCILNDYKEKPNGRYLLVIPTGGGKTYTSIKGIVSLYEKKVLDSQKDEVLWIAWTQELLEQAKRSFEKYVNGNNKDKRILNMILYKSNVSAHNQDVLMKNSSIKFIVIDEAHHSAASTYKHLFEKREKEVGVLGLTATPSRTDGEELDFERETFSIGFPDLVELGIVLEPEIISIPSNQDFLMSNLDKESLESLNNDERNLKIIKSIKNYEESFNKIIIYVGTEKHVDKLYKDLINTDLVNRYESISYITHKGNSRNQGNSEFFETERSFNKSIIVNVHMMAEGYDDPKINTVIMAYPTQSKLKYMQAIGRAIRLNEDDELKKAYVVEVVDDLPNIKHKIDNRWLYAEISELLEPNIIDEKYNNIDDLRTSIEKYYRKYNVNQNKYKIPILNDKERYNIILFKRYNKGFEHIPIILNRENRQKVLGDINYISNNLAFYVKHPSNVFNEQRFNNIDVLSEEKNNKSDFFSSLKNSVSDDEELIEKENPYWLTYITFKRELCCISIELEDFLNDVVNKQIIISILKNNNYISGSYIIKLPLLLGNFIGKIVSKDEYIQIEEIISNLKKIKDHHIDMDHDLIVKSYLGEVNMPIENRYLYSLICIAREGIVFQKEIFINENGAIV